MLKAAWEEVTPLTVRNCFAKAGFFCTVEPEIEILDIPDGWSKISNGSSYEDYLSVDENLSPFGHRTDDEILGLKKMRENESSDEEEEAIAEERLPTSSEAIDHLEKTSKYIEGQENVPDSVFAAARTLESFLLHTQILNKSQKKINFYFKSASLH